MPTFNIPCEVYARLAAITDTIYHDGSGYCKTIRIEDGRAIVTNRKLMAIEYIGGELGTGHIVVDPALVEQCKRETAYSSVLTVSMDHTMRFATAKTTFGYVHPGNAGYWSDEFNELLDWKKAIPAALPVASQGVMFWDAALIAMLARSAPTGGVVFPEFIDTSGPIIIRDASDDRWCGVFLSLDQPAGGAKIPEWVR